MSFIHAPMKGYAIMYLLYLVILSESTLYKCMATPVNNSGSVGAVLVDGDIWILGLLCLDATKLLLRGEPEVVDMLSESLLLCLLTEKIYDTKKYQH